jgi:voltage-gated potassium channel
MRAQASDMAGLLNGNGAMDPTAGLLALVLNSAQSNGLGGSLTDLKNQIRDGVARDPLEALAVTVLGGSFLFYLAEKDENPKVTTYIDALTFISTCLSVGYADIFAKTQAGKAIATAIMMVGPAMAAKALDPPSAAVAAADDASLAVQRTIVEKLDAILGELKKAG